MARPRAHTIDEAAVAHHKHAAPGEDHAHPADMQEQVHPKRWCKQRVIGFNVHYSLAGRRRLEARPFSLAPHARLLHSPTTALLACRFGTGPGGCRVRCRHDGLRDFQHLTTKKPATLSTTCGFLHSGATKAQGSKTRRQMGFPFVYLIAHAGAWGNGAPLENVNQRKPSALHTLIQQFVTFELSICHAAREKTKAPRRNTLLVVNYTSLPHRLKRVSISDIMVSC